MVMKVLMIRVRDKNGIYEPNKRSKYLQKYKKFMEEEFKIIGFQRRKRR
jgi:ATP-dependent DNA ligase